MNTDLVITDLTRMFQGRVCIAGYDKDHHCIRPTLPPPGIPESSLSKQGRPIIFPFALVDFDLLRPTPQPPHTEDYRFVAESPRFIRQIHNREEILSWSLFESVESIFEQQVHTDFGFYVMDCQGPRSVGTVQPRFITEAIYEPGPEGSWDYRLIFADGQGEFYRLKITDLTWHYYCDSLRGEANDPTRIASTLTTTLKSSKVYLRIGLSRGWKKFPDRCYLQINGIYTFPDYLKGKTFADLKSG
jgi:hypothetical protein